ncbi:hypothetical protein J3L11_01130 [Shewanella sp. 4t3-1-2LB]|uniref:hypothetical protein n=1 Tax=Shewanella sp. 4t3-1-2LB TaxID=2817682 RepID=UPI001A9A23BE|nr:hypothetical protein [Shewanella sp. 4t3-1-2LB]MBO1270260.1 hypothetical protein [Shewanella sp. 4t3-1-2LB]
MGFWTKADIFIQRIFFGISELLKAALILGFGLLFFLNTAKSFFEYRNGLIDIDPVEITCFFIFMMLTIRFCIRGRSLGISWNDLFYKIMKLSSVILVVQAISLNFYFYRELKFNNEIQFSDFVMQRDRLSLARYIVTAILLYIYAPIPKESVIPSDSASDNQSESLEN